MKTLAVLIIATALTTGLAACGSFGWSPFASSSASASGKLAAATG